MCYTFPGSARAVPEENGALPARSVADPLIYLAAAAFLTAISALASFIPAYRASRVDPMIALRYE